MDRGFRVELTGPAGSLDMLRKRGVIDDIWVHSLSNWGDESCHLPKAGRVWGVGTGHGRK